MSADIKTGDYVTARHVNGDVLTGLVLKVESPAEMLVRTGAVIAQLELAEWELERAWRDGIYEKGGAVRIRREGRWLAPEWVPECGKSRWLGLSDAEHADWRYVGRGLSW